MCVCVCVCVWVCVCARAPQCLKGPCCQNEIIRNCETPAQGLSNKLKMKAQDENLTSVESVKSLVTKKVTFAEKHQKVVLTGSSQKIPPCNCVWNISVTCNVGSRELPNFLREYSSP